MDKTARSDRGSPFALLAILTGSLFIISSCGGGGGSGVGGDNGTNSSYNVTLSAMTVSSNSINLSWTDPTGQFIWTPQDVFSFIYRGGGKITTAYGFSYIDTGLQPETTYCYDVTVGAVYCILWSCGTYGWDSNSACATTLPDTASPSVPANVSAVALSVSEIRLSWDDSVDNTAVTGYSIYRDGTFFANSTSNSITDPMLSSNTTHCYSVLSYDAAGNESAQSTSACATTLMPVSIIDSASDGACYNNSMAIDPSDKLHIAYINRNDASTYELRYATNASGVWAKTTVDTSWGYPSIATDALNKVHIATTSQCISNSTGTWVAENYFNNGAVPSIEIDGSGKTHIGFYVESPSRALLYTNNLIGSWNTDTISQTFFSTWPSLGLDSNAKAHVVFTDGNVNGLYLYYANNTSGSWVSVGIGGPFPTGTSCGVGEGYKIVVDSAGHAHIVFRNTYYTNASGTWKSEVYDAGGTCPSLALDQSNNPHIVYSAYDANTATNRLRHAAKGQNGWSGTALAVVNLQSNYYSIAVDSSGGGLHISYCDGGNLTYLKK